MSKEEILTTLLNEVEMNPQAKIDDVLLAKAKEFDLSDTDQKMLLDAFKIVDRISEEHQKLISIRENGGTRDTYISQGVSEIAEDKSEEQLNEIAKAVHEVANTQVLMNKAKEN